MDDVLGYRGKTVTLTGAASGMGDAAARLLVDLGAEVHALDIAKVSAPVDQAITVDLKDGSSIDAALSDLPTKIHAHFNCAGVPHPPFPASDCVLINFVGLRYLTEALIPRMDTGSSVTSIASTAGMAWARNLDQIDEFLDLDGFEAAKAWLDGSLPADPYGFSKQAIIVYTMGRAKALAERGVRINCISPSPTATTFMDRLTEAIPKEAVKLFCPSPGRFADAQEMARALVMLGSDLGCFVSGQNLPVDFGYTAEVRMGQRDNLMGI